MFHTCAQLPSFPPLSPYVLCQFVEYLVSFLPAFSLCVPSESIIFALFVDFAFLPKRLRTCLLIGDLCLLFAQHFCTSAPLRWKPFYTLLCPDFGVFYLDCPVKRYIFKALHTVCITKNNLSLPDCLGSNSHPHHPTHQVWPRKQTQGITLNTLNYKTLKTKNIPLNKTITVL